MIIHKCQKCGSKSHNILFKHPYEFCPYCGANYSQVVTNLSPGEIEDIVKETTIKYQFQLDNERTVMEYLAEIGPGYEEWRENGKR